jgi:16S rRNA (adenine1518-N6/adenine1519-N6)-dimethyltransferase
VRLDDVDVLRHFLARHGLSADKGLGQHFLVSGSIAAAIGERLSDCRGLLEIGPGPGILTGPLSEDVESLIALELDPRMGPLLAESAPKAEIVFGDALTYPLTELLARLPEPRGLVSNLPYYITGPLLDRVSGVRDHIQVAVLMMQREVADKIAAPAGNGARGAVSVHLQACFDIRSVIKAPATAFLPPPKVDSMVLELKPRSLPVSEANFATFLEIVRAGFVHPRKTLANNLAAFGRDRVQAALAALGLPLTVRPHQLGEADWVKLQGLLYDRIL